MGAVFEWLSSNTQVAYPFKAQQADGSEKLFVDAWISHNLQQDVQQSAKIALFDPAGSLTVLFADNTPLAILTVSDGFQVVVFGDYTIYEWALKTLVGVGYTGECINAKIVVLTSALTDFSYPLVPPDGTLIDSLVNCAIKRVRRIGIALPGLPCCVGGGFVSTDKVIFQAGNNMEIGLAQDSSPLDLGLIQVTETRPKSVVVFDVVPGAGAGRFIDCDVTVPPPIKLINKIGPDDQGGFRLTGEACTWVERVVASVGPPVNPNTDFSATIIPALLRLHQDCKACCDCDDYKRAYEMLIRLWNQLYKLGQLLDEYRRRYNELVNYINEQRQIVIDEKHELNIDQLQVVLQLVSTPNYNLGISATIFNNSKTDMQLIMLKFTVNNSDFIYVPGSGLLDTAFNRNLQLDPVVGFVPFLPDPDPIIPGDTFTISIPALKSGQYAAYSLNVRSPSEKYFPGGLTPEQLALIGNPLITVYASASVGNIVAEDVQKQALKPPGTFV